MEEIFKTRLKNIENKEQEELKLENFKQLADLKKSDLSLQPLTMSNKNVKLKKSSSYISIFNNGINLDKTKKSFNNVNLSHKTNSINSSNIFSTNLNFTALNEDIKNNSFTKNSNIIENTDNNKSINTQLYSKNFNNLIKINDFNFDSLKYDKKILSTLNNKVKELEDKFILVIKYYYQIENLYLSQCKKKSDLEIVLNIVNKEMNGVKNEYEKIRQKNVELNNALLNSKNEINRLIKEIKEEQKLKINKQEEYNESLLKEEKEKEKLKSELKINERQINILEERISYSNLSHTEKLKKYQEKMKLENNNDTKYENLMKKNGEIFILKNTIKELQLEADNLQKELRNGQKNKEKLLSEIKLKERKKKFNNDNINLLYKTIDQYNEDEHFNRNILKAKNLIIKNMYDRANGNVKIPHYSLPKNIRINSAQKSKNTKNNIINL